VDEPGQSLDDGEIHYAKLGTLILMKVLPYAETTWRYLVFNTRSQQVNRIDAIGQSCVQLPADHGLIFPGGYYLQSGETKTFEGDVSDMEFQRVIRSPNGEDVVFIFHRRDEGRSILLPYNMIRKEVQNPIHCHGFSIFADGRLVIFRSTSDEPTRVHPMQIWQTPFMSDEHAAAAPTTGSYLERVGNSDLVQGISDAFSVCRLVEAQEPSLQVYEDLIAATVRVADAYYWLDHTEIGDLLAPLKQVRSTGELIVDEFEKVQTIRQQAEEAVAAAETAMAELFNRLRAQEMTSIDRFVAGLAELRNQRGHLIGLKELRYADLERIDRLEAQIIEQFDELSGRAVDFLVGEEALRPYHTEIDELVTRAEAIEKATEAAPIREALDAIGDGMELLTEVIGSLKIDDATIRTQILEGISEVLSSLNRGRAILQARRKELLST
ncbi:MAG: hypothetical protein GY867_10095, partial [bacterium]|nr:hypothetical protein [bacterium]